MKVETGQLKLIIFVRKLIPCLKTIDILLMKPFSHPSMYCFLLPSTYVSM